MTDAPDLSTTFFDRLDACVRDRIPQHPLELSGEWTTSLRRTYRSAAQDGTGSGPFVDVVDARWRGALSAASAFSGVAFLAIADGIYWAKAPEISPVLPVEVSLHAYADRKPNRATFHAGLRGAGGPGVPVDAADDLARTCTLAAGAVVTGRALCLARAASAAFYVLLIPREMLKMGRKRLWSLRDDIASGMPDDLRALLTRRRAGFVRADARSS